MYYSLGLCIENTILSENVWDVLRNDDGDIDDGWMGGWDPGVEGQVSSPTLEVFSFDFTSNSG